MKYFRVKQAADYLGVTPQTIRNWSNNGELAHSYSGAGQRLYTLEDWMIIRINDWVLLQNQ